MHSPLAALYLLTFITVCAFCLLNLYVGVVFFQFSRIRLLAQTGAVFMSDRQQQWVEMAKMTFRARPREIPPVQTVPVRQWARRLSMSKRFEIAVLSVVVANVIVMALNTYGQSRAKTTMFERINLVCSLAVHMASCATCVGAECAWGPALVVHWGHAPWQQLIVVVIDLHAHGPGPCLWPCMRLFKSRGGFASQPVSSDLWFLSQSRTMWSGVLNTWWQLRLSALVDDVHTL